MINNFQYDVLFNDLVVMPDEQNNNKYIIKNKLDETDAIVIGTIEWKEDNFYATFKNYVDLEAEYLRGIAEYMEGLEYVSSPQPDSAEPQNMNNLTSMGDLGGLAGLAGMLGGMGGGMPPMDAEPVPAEVIETEEVKEDENNS